MRVCEWMFWGMDVLVMDVLQKIVLSNVSMNIIIEESGTASRLH